MGLQLSWCDSLLAPRFPATEYEALRLRVLRSTPFNHLGWQRQWASDSSHFERQLSCRVPTQRIRESDRQEVSGPPRYKLRRARKRLAACGARERRVVATVENIGEVLDAISRVEQASWKGGDGVGIFSGRQRQQWMYQALTALAAHGLVRVVLHEVEGRCISYRLGLLEHGRLYDYNLAFLPEFHELGSGRVLLEEWLRWGLDDGWQWLDASRVSLDNSTHQLHERMTDHIEQWRLNSFSWRLDGVCVGLAMRCWQWLKPRLRKSRGKSPDTRGQQPDAIPDAAP